MRLLLALVIAVVPASDGISAFAGGRSKSPDGKWAVWAAPADADSERAAAVARLNGPGVRDRMLLRFARRIDVVWPLEAPDTVLLVQRTTRFAALYAFALGSAEVLEDRIQSDLDRALAHREPRLGSIENRSIAFGRLGTATCVLVAETGLPTGRQASGPLVRRGAFRLDLGTRRAAPVADCPGARID